MRLAALLSFSLILPWPAQAETRLLDFLGQEACAVGPATRDKALAAGIRALEFDAFMDNAATTREGAWLVIAPEDCTILMPKIGTELSFTDPDIAALISGPEGVDDYSGPGCFIGYVDDMVRALMKSRGWDEAKANREYFRLLGAGFASGEVGFYGENPLETPYSSRYIGPGCDQGPGVAEIRASHDFLTAHFDQIIREAGSYVACKEGAAISSGWIGPIQQDWSERGAKNVWLVVELLFLSMAAGWQQGWDHEKKGTPRPPLCREQPLEQDWSRME
ncbi:hypothetical protein [Pseudogemmobacter bohemicus]|uniref:hypothetical protein n=1 Tax=Pseudogemmobacter bohemicus TaxID=2250708 RepID=UPI000DD3A019|nr:hypothetical protein [Pseudogemmobacter bohemicus]